MANKEILLNEPGIKEIDESDFEIDPSNFFEVNQYGKPVKFIPKKLGDWILKKYSFKTIRSDESIYAYINGYYHENGQTLINEICVDILGDYFSKQKVNEVIFYIKSNSYIDSEDLEHYWINFKNGLFNPLTKEFKEHTPDIFCLNQIPYEYNPEAKCALWEKTLSEKFEKDYLLTLQEYFGYLFLNDNRYEKAFLFHGPKRTMKSTILNISGDLLGVENVQAFGLYQLTNDNFIPAYLFAKKANICADLQSNELKNVSVFLKLTGQDRISYGKKNKDYKTWLPTLKLLFSCNIIPSTYNKDDAFYRRWIIIQSLKPHKEIDPNLREKLKNEISGIFNWSMEGLARLLKNDKFSYPLSENEVKNLYEKNSDSVNSFIETHINTEDDDGVLVKRQVYKKYKEYCKINKLEVKNPTWFGRIFTSTTGCGNRRLGTLPAYSGVEFI